MDIAINTINPTFVEHEGFYYLEFEGDFYKGCKRCGGEGHFSHNGEHSRCYECDNTSAKLGVELASREAAEKWCHERAVRKAQRERAREAQRLALVANMEKYQRSLKADDAEVYEFLMTIKIENDTQEQYSTYEEWARAQQAQSGANLEKDGFIRAMAETLRWVGPAKPFTPNMIAAVRRTMERRQEQATEAASHPAPTGRVAVTGEITSTKMVEGDYGTAYKILVKDDAGFKVWCSIPKAQHDEAAYEEGYESFSSLKGRRITFTATLSPSTDDASFAFGSRPAKGAWL